MVELSALFAFKSVNFRDVIAIFGLKDPCREKYEWNFLYSFKNGLPIKQNMTIWNFDLSEVMMEDIHVNSKGI